VKPECEFKLKGCNFVFNNFCECVKSYCENGNECEGFNFYHLYSFVTCNFNIFKQVSSNTCNFICNLFLKIPN
jgi:hypothetical protein